MKTNFEDPRSREGFRPQFYPTLNGTEAPPLNGPGQNDRIAREFLGAYYSLNCEYSHLVEVRKQPASAERAEAERKCLHDVEKALIVRDGVEDRYAPFGVIADPLVRDGFTVDLKISFGNVDAAGRLRSDYYTLTTIVPIPFPKGTKLEDLPLKIEGPGFGREY